MYTKMVWYRKPTVYEVIMEHQPIFLYMDIDLSLTNEDFPLTHTEVDNLIKYIKQKLIQHLDMSFPDHQQEFDHNNNLIILQSCSSMKFSLHIIHRGVVFDNNSCSCISYVLEFDAFVRNDIQSGIRRPADEEAESIDILNAKNRLKSHLSFIDKSVYKRSQQFRTLGCSKIRKNRPLLLYCFPLRSWAEDPNYSFVPERFPLTQWLNTLTTNSPEDVTYLSVKPSTHCPFASPIMALSRLYSAQNPIVDNMNAQGRYLQSDASEANPSAHVEELLRTTILPRLQSGSTLIIDDSDSMVDEFGQVKVISSLIDGERVFCMSCETNNNNGILSGVGVCSAKVLNTKSGEKAIHCFNCGITTFILECGDQYGFSPLPDEIIDSPYKKLNFNGRENINFDSCGMLVFLDAPMGSGKTFVAEQFLDEKNVVTKVI